MLGRLIAAAAYILFLEGSRQTSYALGGAGWAGAESRTSRTVPFCPNRKSAPAAPARPALFILPTPSYWWRNIILFQTLDFKLKFNTLNDRKFI